MRFPAVLSLLLVLGLTGTSMADTVVWMNKASASNWDQVEIKFDSQAPHQTGKKMLRLISYVPDGDGCQLTASYTRAVTVTNDPTWNIGFIKSPGGKDKARCLLPNGEIVGTGDIVMYRKNDQGMMDFKIGQGEQGELIEDETFAAEFALK